jgi:hypothetical protein
MAIVMGLDQHRAQITAEWIDTDTGELSRHQPPARRRLQRDLEALTGGRAPVLQALRARVRPALRAVEELRAIGAEAHLAEPAETAARRGNKSGPRPTAPTRGTCASC